MFKTVPILLVALLAGSAALPVASAQAPQAPPPLVDLYLADETLTPDVPTGEESLSREIVTTAATPAATYTPPDWGAYALPGPVNFTSDIVATLWIEPEEATTITNIRVQVCSVVCGGDGEVLEQGELGTIVSSAGENALTEPRKIQISIPIQGIEVAGELNIKILFWGTSVEGTPTSANVLYGSATHPSRLSFGVQPEQAAAFTPSGQVPTLYLAEESLTWDAPTAAESLRRAHGVAGAQNFATSAEFEWGGIKMDRDLRLIGDTTLTFWLASDDPGLMRSVRPVLHIGEEAPTQSAGTRASTFPAAPPVSSGLYRFSVAFDTVGLNISAGTTVSLGFLIWSTNSNEVGTIEYLYGSTEHPARLSFRAAGGATGGAPNITLPNLTLTGPSEDVRVPPGGKGTTEIHIENAHNDTVAVSLSHNATDEVTITYPDGESFQLKPGENRTVRVAIEVRQDSLLNQTYPVTILANVGNDTVSNTTFHVRSLDPEQPEPTDAQGPPETPTNNTTTPNATGRANGGNESGGIPAPGALWLVLLVVVAAAAARRRPR